jgi:hypothetical protein
VTQTPSVTPTFQMIGPTITYMGVARADGNITQPIDTAADGTKIFRRQVGFGFFLIVEAKVGQSGKPIGTSTFTAGQLPNFRMVVSRPLGNGSAAVCDDGPDPPIGGVPAVDPPSFDNVNAVNDLSCRFDARTTANDACTRNANQDPAFANTQTRVQFCPILGLGSELTFPPGDTRVTAEVTDVVGQPGAPQSIIIRVQP